MKVRSNKTRAGAKLMVDINPVACSPWGFLHGEMVDTPKGKAKVLGVAHDQLWMLVDGDSGASFWHDLTQKSDLIRIGIVQMNSLKSCVRKWLKECEDIAEYHTSDRDQPVMFISRSKEAMVPFSPFKIFDKLSGPLGNMKVEGVFKPYSHSRPLLYLRPDGDREAFAFKGVQDYKSLIAQGMF